MSHVLVIGAGPAGLATAACLSRRGVPIRLVDRTGVAGGAYRLMYDGIRLASPVSMLALPGLALPATEDYIGVVEYRAYLADYARHHGLTAVRGAVTRVERDGPAFRVTVDGVTERAAAVVVATGMFDFPVTPALPVGAPIRAIHSRDWRGPGPEKAVVIVGGGTAAVEIAEELARAGRPVTLSARRPLKLVRQRLLGRDLQEWLTPFERLPTWLGRSWCEGRPTVPATDLGFRALRRRGLIDVRPAIERAGDGELRFVDGSRAPAELVVFATGYRYDTPFLPPEVARTRAGHVRARRGESVSWPGLFMVGSPCASRLTSELLRGVRLDSDEVAARVAARLRA